jgi:hypothetical protein
MAVTDAVLMERGECAVRRVSRGGARETRNYRRHRGTTTVAGGETWVAVLLLPGSCLNSRAESADCHARAACEGWSESPVGRSSQRRSQSIRSTSDAPWRVAFRLASEVNVPVVRRRPLSPRPLMAPRKSPTTPSPTLPFVALGLE